jgi:hypothetical protein
MNLTYEIQRRLFKLRASRLTVLQNHLPHYISTTHNNKQLNIIQNYLLDVTQNQLKITVAVRSCHEAVLSLLKKRAIKIFCIMEGQTCRPYKNN